jgi:hypothetical protein
VLGRREAALAHLLGIFARCRPDLVARRRYRLTNFGVNSVKRPSMSSITRICPSQAGEPPIPIVGTATAAVSSRARLSATPSMTSGQHVSAPRRGHWRF